VNNVPRRVAPGAELALFRIAQESLRNVERHSGASRVTVRLTYATNEIRLTVSDDGEGFELPSYSTLAGAGRLGLLGIYERARLAGGTCRIDSHPGKGTRIEARVPTGGVTAGGRREPAEYEHA
jgi:signal transduction histidine kinase